MVPTRTDASSDGPAAAGGTREQLSPSHDEALVMVQREWNGWRSAMIRVADLENVHWARPGGAPSPVIHASVRCNRFVAGELPHECHLTPPPHHLLVCLLKRHTATAVFEELSRRADERGITPVTQPQRDPCAEDADGLGRDRRRRKLAL